MDDNAIVELLWQREEAAISRMSGLYGNYCRAVANNILGNPEDCEECVNDMYLRVWNSIPPAKPDNLKLYMARITRNLSINLLNRKNAGKRGGSEIGLVLDELEECVSDGSQIEDDMIAAELSDSINAFARTLPEKQRSVFIRRYFFAEPCSVIAVKYGLSESNVMTILSRTRTKLKKHLVKEGYIRE